MKRFSEASRSAADPAKSPAGGRGCRAEGEDCSQGAGDQVATAHPKGPRDIVAPSVLMAAAAIMRQAGSPHPSQQEEHCRGSASQYRAGSMPHCWLTRSVKFCRLSRSLLQFIASNTMLQGRFPWEVALIFLPPTSAGCNPCSRREASRQASSQAGRQAGRQAGCQHCACRL